MLTPSQDREREVEVSVIDSVLTDSSPCYSNSADYVPTTGDGAKGPGSSILGATFNFTNSIIGAGAMGLGGAIAASGGLVSIASILFFATLSKVSNDMIIALTDYVERCAWNVQRRRRRRDDFDEDDDIDEDGYDIHDDHEHEEVLLDDDEVSSSSLALLRAVRIGSGRTGMNGGVSSRGGGRGQYSAASSVTYETLGELAYGTIGALAVLASKGFYSFGCLVAYIVVIKDNFGSGIEGAIYGGSAGGGNGTENDNWFRELLRSEKLFTLIMSTVVVLPLCLVRDISPLAKFSFISILAMLAILGIVIYLFITLDPNATEEGLSDSGVSGFDERGSSSRDFVDDWLVVRPGFFASLGAFVFTFVAQHTVHLTYESMKNDVRNLRGWKRVSLYSITISATVSLLIGLFVYMTFWDNTKSDIFELYPSSLKAVDAAKVFLSVSMLLTFPLPFCTCREMVILLISRLFSCCCFLGSSRCCLSRRCCRRKRQGASRSSSGTSSTESGWKCCGGPDHPTQHEMGLRESLLAEEFGAELKDSVSLSFALSELPEFNGLAATPSQRSWLLPGEERQLVTVYHFLLTVLLWAITTVIAIAAPSLGDVLDVVGCLSGTVIAFLLPGLFSLKLVGYSRLALTIVIVGVLVGSVGTFFSMRKLVMDIMN